MLYKKTWALLSALVALLMLVSACQPAAPTSSPEGMTKQVQITIDQIHSNKNFWLTVNCHKLIVTYYPR